MTRMETEWFFCGFFVPADVVIVIVAVCFDGRDRKSRLEEGHLQVHFIARHR